MKKLILAPIFTVCLVLTNGLPAYLGAAGNTPLTEQEACLLNVLKDAPDQLTIGEARSRCSADGVEPVDPDAGKEDRSLVAGVVEKRLEVDDTNILKPFTLMSHRNNYILLAAHNFQGWDEQEYQDFYNVDSIDVDDTEVQFQLSIKTPLAVNLFEENLDIFAAYTVRSFWQLYNNDNSSPFRETNHEPEIWLQVRPELELFGFKNTVSLLGFNHMSNGQGGDLSRSWNRIFAAFAFERGDFAILLRPWLRIQEEDEDDDNPDITDYYGHGELWLAYKHDEHTFSFMTRNNLESGFSRGAVELGWSFPLFNYPFLKGYIQYFSGYGESLIDYNRYVNRIGFGLQLTDML